MEDKTTKVYLLNFVKNNIILSGIFKCLPKLKFLNTIRYNKSIQNRLNININDYKDNAKIEIEIISEDDIISSGKIINISEDKSYYHIYLNDDKNETKRSFFCEGENIRKIKIILDYNILSLCGLFKECEYVQNIKITKFQRRDINDMSYMFYGCSFLKEIDISKLYTKNVKDMRGMFSECSLLKKLNLSNFNTENVEDMSYMFSGCKLLKELDLTKFNTKNVKYMSYMFYRCLSLEKLNIANFDINNVINMPDMFSECSSLRELDISTFNFSNVKYLKNMFSSCSEELKEKIRKSNKTIKSEAFD